MGSFNDLTGKTFGLLTVIGHAGVQESAGGVRFQMWRCRCECGGEKVSRSNNLVSGRNKSCGCRSHGHKKHGLYGHPLRSTRSSMIQRCENPNSPAYSDYGGRGIKVCSEWRNSLESFVGYMESLGWHQACGLSIDRIDNDGDYEPGNVRLASPVEQSRNQRRNRMLAIGGESKPIAEWAEDVGMPYARLISRLNRGWDPVKAISTPSLR